VLNALARPGRFSSLHCEYFNALVLDDVTLCVCAVFDALTRPGRSCCVRLCWCNVEHSHSSRKILRLLLCLCCVQCSHLSWTIVSHSSVCSMLPLVLDDIEPSFVFLLCLPLPVLDDHVTFFMLCYILLCLCYVQRSHSSWTIM
jgi:hypothetical protein